MVGWRLAELSVGRNLATQGNESVYPLIRSIWNIDAKYSHKDNLPDTDHIARNLSTTGAECDERMRMREAEYMRWKTRGNGTLGAKGVYREISEKEVGPLKSSLPGSGVRAAGELWGR